MTDIKIKVYENERGGKYYCYDGIMYDIHFPLAWAIGNDFDNYRNDDYLALGPKHCGNCAFYGTIRGVFVGYCANCADLCYEFNTIFCGGGIKHVPGEIVYPTKAASSYEELVTHYPYMKGAIIEQIGIDNYQHENEDDYEEDEDEDDDDDKTPSSLPSLIDMSIEKEHEDDDDDDDDDDDEAEDEVDHKDKKSSIEESEKQNLWNIFLEALSGKKQ